MEKVEQKLSNAAPLVFAGEVRTLQEELAKASSGQGFLLMGGDCAEVRYICLLTLVPTNYIFFENMNMYIQRLSVSSV